MKTLPVFLLLLISTLVASQSDQKNSSSNTTTVITSLFMSFSTAADGKQITSTSTFIFTSTLAPTPSGNSTSDGNSTTSSNSTASSNSSSTSTSNLPTAPTTVAAGGFSGAAPVPGGLGQGPPDGYVAGATALKRNTFLVGLGGFVIGGVLVFL